MLVKFPSVTGRDAAGTRRFLPEDLDGEPTLVLIAFSWQQRSILKRWREFAERLADDHARFEFNTLHVVGRNTGMGPPTVTGGMTPSPGRPSLDDRGIMVFADRTQFKRSLGIVGEASVYAMLVDDEYVVRQAAGMLTESMAEGLVSLLEEWEEANRRWAAMSGEGPRPGAGSESG